MESELPQLTLDLHVAAVHAESQAHLVASQLAERLPR